MKKTRILLSPIIIGIIICLISIINAQQICQVYDDFSSGVLNTSKWEIRQDIEGQPFIDEYWVDINLSNFHTQQNTIGDRRIYLVPKHNFTTGDILGYDVDVVSYEGNHGNMVLLTGDQYIRMGVIGFNNNPPHIVEYGTHHIELKFYEKYLSVSIQFPSGNNSVVNLTLTNPNGNYELYIGSFSGHNGLIHYDYDNFKVCEETSCTGTKEELFCDDFNDGNANGWTAINGNWFVQNGKYAQDIIEGEGWHWKYSLANFTGKNYNFEADIIPLTDVAYGGCTIAGYVQGAYNPPSGEHIALAVFPRTDQISLYVPENHSQVEYIYKTNIVLGQKYNVKARIKKGFISVFFNGEEIISNKSISTKSGSLYLVSDDTHCLFDNVRVTSNNPLIDSDNDGVSDSQDKCPNTKLPERFSLGLHNDRYGDVDGDTIFETLKSTSSNRTIIDTIFNLNKTYGCSCKQIISLGYGNSREKKIGCKRSTIRTFITENRLN